MITGGSSTSSTCARRAPSSAFPPGWAAGRASARRIRPARSRPGRDSIRGSRTASSLRRASDPRCGTGTPPAVQPCLSLRPPAPGSEPRYKTSAARQVDSSSASSRTAPAARRRSTRASTSSADTRTRSSGTALRASRARGSIPRARSRVQGRTSTPSGQPARARRRCTPTWTSAPTTRMAQGGCRIRARRRTPMSSTGSCTATRRFSAAPASTARTGRTATCRRAGRRPCHFPSGSARSAIAIRVRLKETTIDNPTGPDTVCGPTYSANCQWFFTAAGRTTNWQNNAAQLLAVFQNPVQRAFRGQHRTLRLDQVAPADVREPRQRKLLGGRRRAGRPGGEPSAGQERCFYIDMGLQGRAREGSGRAADRAQPW